MSEKIDTLQAEISQLKDIVRILRLRVAQLEQTKNKSDLDRTHLIRVKNKEELSDQYLLKSMGYLDLSPNKAFKLYSNKDMDFILLDVSHESYTPFKNLSESQNIPLEELEDRISELPSKSRHIIIISEKGVRSILACKLLNQYGFYHLSHISGGYKYWPGFRLSYDNSEFDDFLKEA